jgi:hypothetical protein
MNFENSTKQLFKQSKFFALAVAMALVSCKGEEGEIGPKGDTGPAGVQGSQGTAGASFDKAFENGFIKGTITGKRRDGTAFTEPFEYKMTTNHASFESISATEHSLSIWRSKGMSDYHNDAFMNMKVTNKDQAGATAKFNNAHFSFTKVLASNNLFLVEAGPSFIAKAIVIPMSRTNNATYKLVNNGVNPQYYYEPVEEVSYLIVKDTDGNRIFFKNIYMHDNALGKYYNPFAYVINNNGVKSTASALWNNVRLYQDNNGNMFGTSTGTNLSETINVPADTQEITNVVYNAANGLLTFDYKLNISEFREFDRAYERYEKGNSTMHPLEVKGSFSATVYNGVVMRKGFE